MEPDRRDAMRAAGRLGAIGMEMGAGVVGGLLVGSWVDRKWSVGPYGTLLGALIGMVAAFRSLIRLVRLEAQASEGDKSSGADDRGKNP